ncbi:MAG: hypothetical protein ABI114_06485 [Rhodanobacter sp.]
MARLELTQAPPASLPRRFLLTAPWWGMLAGALLLVDGDSLLRSRWDVGTLSLVHVFTLGVLGNIMFGSILQFLPVVVAVPVRGGVRLGRWLHGLFNVGVLALVVGLHQRWRPLLETAAVLLPVAFATLAAMTLPGLWASLSQRLLRVGFGVALSFGVLTALLGAALTLGLSGHLGESLPRLVDVHASFGVLGWMLVLLATVARVVMPMFQGTGTVPAAAQTAWLASVVLTVSVAALLYGLNVVGATALLWVLLLHSVLFAGAVLWLQWRARQAGRGPLRWSWRAGASVMLLSALVLGLDARNGLLAGAWGLAIALPLLLMGMMQEIVAFIGWIELRRQCRRGVQVPGVQRLLPDLDKRRVLLAQLPVALLLTAAVLWPTPWLARCAGAALILAWLVLWVALAGVRRRARRFLLSVELPSASAAG